MSTPPAVSPIAARPAPEGPGSASQVGQLGRLRETAQEFEALFLAQMLATVNQGLGLGLTGKSSDADIYQDMFNQEVARLISRTGGIGVADAILREMLKMQEVA